MARYSNPSRPPRNTAPLWKKLAVVASAPIAIFIVVSLLHANRWNYGLFVLLVVVVAVVAVWGTAKVLGVRLSLRSWD